MTFKLSLRGDRVVWIIVFLLTVFGLLGVYSSTGALAYRFRDGNVEAYLFKHAALLALGYIGAYFVHKVDYRFWARVATPLLATALLLLVFTLTQGEEYQINRANRWVSLWGMSFQPSDLAKFALTVFLAKALAKRQERIKDFRKGFIPVFLVVLAVCGLIAPANLSTAALVFVSSTGLMYVAGVRFKYLAGLVGAGIAGTTFLILTVPRAATWKQRLHDYFMRIFDSAYEPHYQIVQSNVALVNGGFFGMGPGHSVQRNFLPHPYSDFIYSILVEEYGFLGGIIILSLFLWLMFRTLAVAVRAKTFGALLAFGLALTIVSQALINIGVTAGLLPVTGLPLPLVSMGGTSIVFTSVSVGVILSVARSLQSEGRDSSDDR
ncbi:MAG: FtsW/RodA/SpoVE family cell cycle protein [Bacteroidia bacterium]|nr:FtsW/RodA/SpoVE family cell cycle protein [Bacteroidia bacterium]MDW8334840.1 FtsW/RodA/SpoVE family cell cycle protein [Bacteroidia bacterium]